MALEFQNNPSPSLLMVEAVDETDPTPDALPAAGQRRLIVGPDHLLYLLDDAGVATAVGGSGDVATDAIWDAAGDLAVGSGANTAAKLTKGSNGDVLTVTAGAVGWAAPAAAGLTTVVANLTTGDVSLTQNTFTDVLSVSLTAGTWIVMAQVPVSVSAVCDSTARIFDSTNTVNYASSGMSHNAANYVHTHHMSTKIVAAGTITVKLQATATNSGTRTAKQALASNAAGNTATQITALKVA